ncbi:MAG: RAMP superfamily CRISPR-associated protein [Ktedonobacteraceae bacterium]
MPKPSWSGAVSRQIVQRIVVEGDLVLQTPAHFGNGDGADLVDMPLLTDPLDNKTPLLTGTSIAGALRGYVREREHGFRQKIDPYTRADQSASVLLFGGNKGNEYGEQSPLIVEDARGKNAAIELRDGVRLAGVSRTSAEDALFTIEMWEAGTTFPLRFELIVRSYDNASALKRALATALVGFNDDSITIGARKRRGYGQVSVTGWRVKAYDLTNTEELLDWIANGANELSGTASPDIVQALGVGEMIADQRRAFRLKGTFSLDGSLLIRSGSGPDIAQTAANVTDGQQPDMVHLHSARLASPLDKTRKRMPIVSGTSLAGALRARAFKIARLLAPQIDAGKTAAREVIEGMFGVEMEKMELGAKPRASRITVSEHEVHMESEVKNTLIQQRVSLDRFTGGARDSALFSQQPLFGGPQSQVIVELRLANPQEYEIGLLLLVLKDLWSGDLPLGGEVSVGRGRLRGQHCHLEYQNGQVRSWDLSANEANGLDVAGGQSQDLEHYVAALHAHLDGRNP